MAKTHTVNFPPTFPSGPDVLAWLDDLSVGGRAMALRRKNVIKEFYEVCVQVKLYKSELTEQETEAIQTLLSERQTDVRILFTGIGAKVKRTRLGILVPEKSLSLSSTMMSKTSVPWEQNCKPLSLPNSKMRMTWIFLIGALVYVIHDVLYILLPAIC